MIVMVLIPTSHLSAIKTFFVFIIMLIESGVYWDIPYNLSKQYE